MNRLAIRAFIYLLTLPVVLLLFGFADTGPRQQKVLIAEMPLHLEDHLDAAHIEGSKVPADVPKPVVWRFDEPQPDWKMIDPCKFEIDSKPAAVVQTEDARRIVLTKANAITRQNRRRRQDGERSAVCR